MNRYYIYHVVTLPQNSYRSLVANVGHFNNGEFHSKARANEVCAELNKQKKPKNSEYVVVPHPDNKE